jgi:hypothetical protein
MGVVADMFKSPKSSFDAKKAIAAQGEQNQQAFQTNQDAFGNQFKANAQAAGNTNPFGYAGYSFDPNTGMPTGFSKGFSDPLQGTFNNATGAYGAQSGLLPAGFDFSSTSVPGILASGANFYDAATADNDAQQRNSIEQNIANRGLPINDKIATDLRGNYDRSSGLARQGFLSNLYSQVPGWRNAETQTAIAQGMAPGNQTLQTGNILNQLQGYLPGINQPTLGTAQMGTVDAMGAMSTEAKMLQQAKDQQAKMWGNVAQVAGGWLGGGGLGTLGGLFNGSMPGDGSGN